MEHCIKPLLDRLEAKIRMLHKLRFEIKYCPVDDTPVGLQLEKQRFEKEIKRIKAALRALGYDYGKLTKTTLEVMLANYREVLLNPAIKRYEDALDRVCAIVVHNQLLDTDDEEGEALAAIYSITPTEHGFTVRGATAGGHSIDGDVTFDMIERFDKLTPKDADFERASSPDTYGKFYDV